MAFSIPHSTGQSWGLLYLRSGLFAGIGTVIVFAENPQSFVLISLSALLSIAGLLAVRFRQVSRIPGTATNWFLTAGLLDIVAGLALLFYLHHPNQGIVLVVGAWGILVGLIQAVEVMYVFIGLQTSDKTKDISGTLIHFLNVLICGGIAFMLLLQPLGEDSMQFVGWFFVALSIPLLFLTRRLQVDIGTESPKKEALLNRK
jgi:hypothetical protein